MYVIELFLYVILGIVVVCFAIFLLIELYNVFFESLNSVKNSSLKIKIKNFLYSDYKKINELKIASQKFHKLAQSGVLKNKLLPIKNNDIVYYMVDDYLIRLPDENFKYYHIIFLNRTSFLIDTKEFLFQVNDDTVIISDVKDYPYLMIFFSKLDVYIK